MKKLIILLLSLAVLIGLGFYVNELMQTKGISDAELISFAIDDVNTIDKVIITNSNGGKLEVRKTGSGWVDSKGNCLIQESIDYMLDAFKNIEFKGYLGENEKEHFRTQMIARHTKIEVFQKGAWTTTWYLGPSTPDHYGQIMLLESKEKGKSKYPVIMRIKNMNGIIEPRFVADYREWMCKDIFSLKREEIKEVDLKFTREPSRNFTIRQSGAAYSVLHNGQPLPITDSASIYDYLKNFRDINFSIANYALSKTQIDSLKASSPFCVMNVTETNGTKSRLRMFDMKVDSSDYMENGQVEIENNSRDVFWAELPDGSIVKCQFFHFDPILKGHLYFPGLKPED